MAEDDRRVEVRLELTGRGMSATPERIAELTRQAEQVEKSHRPPPVRAFDAVLADKGLLAAKPALTLKQKKLAALPKKGPAPKLLHPSQRATFGRDDAQAEPVILKG